MSTYTATNHNHTESPIDEMKHVISDTVEDVRYDLKEGASRLADQVGRVKSQVQETIQERRDQVQDQLTGKHYTLGALGLSFVFGLVLGKLFK